MLARIDRNTIPLSCNAYVRFVPYGSDTSARVMTTRLVELRRLANDYWYIADSPSLVALGIWVDGLGRIDGVAAETFIRTIARRVDEAMDRC
ncbi:hypothetical protein [Ancylobacter defluvii]|uniref:Uncharacterized protein n=1 Tax=Ancylobacter defluvii TaxID=1282440 RepID=A0A9W6JS06_9HYPH|nr:hypothetical protein [Ancylobacter defluvii]MBS7590144.1 hypothetical protein [Ancylobacter defluvii]GLK82770.1 hypothetical protein GCM10017653_08390 [Ancylobacter defluvii]